MVEESSRLEELSYIIKSCMKDKRFQRKQGNELYCILSDKKCPYRSELYLEIFERGEIDGARRTHFYSICRGIEK